MDTTLFLEQFSHLTESPGGVGKLRKLILELAVRGRLVTQNPDDEPASELLKWIEVEKQRMITAGEIKKWEKFPPITEDEIPFQQSQGWEWVRFGTIFKASDYGTSEKASSDLRDGVGVYTMGHIQDGKLRDRNFKYISSTSVELPKLFLRKYDLLFNRTNSYELVGKSALYLGEADHFTFASYIIRVSLFTKYIYPFYVNNYINSRICRVTQIEPEITHQTNQANFNGTKLSRILVPLPPLAEQQRIVAKVDELMALCDQLEAEADTRQSLSGRLFDSVMHHLFEDN